MTRLLFFCLLVAGYCFAQQRIEPPPERHLILWRAPKTMTNADWVWGPGGEQRAPVPPFRFVKEHLGGTNPKVEVQDGRGAKWVVKFGGEVHTEVFASRFLSAVGYAAEPTYFVREGVITGLADLRRAKPYFAKGGRFRNARFKLRDRSTKCSGECDWSWDQNPFVGSHALNGLRILMMLVSNWDAKDARDGAGSNTAVFRQKDAGLPVYLYAMTDWGSSFGSWGGFFKRGRWDAAAYERQTPEFVKGVKDGKVVWGYTGKHCRDITEGITPEDVRWLLPYLSGITEEQMKAGLMASGATRADAEKFSRAIRDRIGKLEEIGKSAATGPEL